MRTQIEIDDYVRELIGDELYEKYAHLTYAEMAREEGLEDYSGELLQAEDDWYAAETEQETNS